MLHDMIFWEENQPSKREMARVSILGPQHEPVICGTSLLPQDSLRWNRAIISACLRYASASTASPPSPPPRYLTQHVESFSKSSPYPPTTLVPDSHVRHFVQLRAT